jgi:hypothetical protein
MNFQIAFGLKNKHLQTIYASLFRKTAPLEYKIERISLSDGDFLECFIYLTCKADAPYVMLFHGLAGSYKSPYIQGIISALHKEGFHVILMHFRGCSGKVNLLPRSYHSGDTQDAKECIAFIQKKYNPSKLYGVGYSLGANMLLKLLGEMQEESPFDKAVAISAPMKLAICANQMNKGFSRYYQYRLIKELKIALELKYKKFPMEKLLHVSLEDIRAIKTFWEFDAIYTAPIHGFSSAQEYYEKSSAFGYLHTIATPTLIIHAKDDPFMTAEVIPTKHDVSKMVTLEITEGGGHVGFVGGSFLKPHYWLDEAIVSFFKD